MVSIGGAGISSSMSSEEESLNDEIAQDEEATCVRGENPERKGLASFTYKARKLNASIACFRPQSPDRGIEFLHRWWLQS